jgi:ribosome maturation factor RimP
MARAEVAREVEDRVEQLGFELVEMEEAGTAGRPILRLRIDRPGSQPGKGVTLEDCVLVSRAVEAHLDELPNMANTYVLEVSSPGVERPLVRNSDFERFAGQRVAVHGKAPLAAGSRKLEGELLGLGGAEGSETVKMRVSGGEELEIPRSEIKRAHLIYRDTRPRRPGR